MTKKILILATLVALAVSAKAQWFDFSNNDERLTLGFHLGANAVGTEYSNFGFGASLSVMGVYMDFMRVIPAHKYDNHVEYTVYDDSASLTINLGYQIPVLSWLRIMPLVGYCQTNYGKTDASSINFSNSDDYNPTLYHDYDVTPGSRKHYFNYGVGLFVTPVQFMDIYAIVSSKAIYGGISVNLAAF